MKSPPDEQVRAGQIANGAIKLGMELVQNGGIDGVHLDREIEAFIRDEGGEPALKGYRPQFSRTPYEYTICLAKDNDVVHGVPRKLIGRESLVTIDLVVRYEGWHADTARTFTFSSDPEKQAFARNSRLIFASALDAIAPLQPISMFGMMVEGAAGIQDYGVVREFCGHGIGKEIHSEPQVLNYQHASLHAFEPGRSYAVEPVLTLNRAYSLSHDSDGWTVSADSLASHNEDTVFISDNGVVNLTGDV